MSRYRSATANTRAPRFVLPLALLILVASAASAAGEPKQTRQIIDRDAQDCNEWQPAVVTAPTEDISEELTLEVHVLLDGISVSRGQEIIKTVQGAYDPLNITIVPTFEELVIVPSTDSGPLGSGEPAHTGALMDTVKDYVHGARPWNSDVVYLLTATEIAGGTAGFADCIGGVRYGTRAFAVGEAVEDGSQEQYLFGTNMTAKIAAHEIAHLLGAHHHYANCAEGEKSTLADDGAPCSLMFNEGGLISLRFSTLEAAVVRAHVAEYAADTPTGPEPAQPRTLSLRINKKSLARGYLDSPHNFCSVYSPVEIQRLVGGEWSVIAMTETESNGTYRVSIEEGRGSYRALATQTYYIGERSRESCAETPSPTVERV